MSKEYASQLAKSNKFDPGALPTNREGKLTDSQRQKLYIMLGSVSLSSLLAVIFGILSMVAAVLIFPRENLFGELIRTIGSIIMFVLGIWWIVAGSKNILNSWQPLLKDINGGKIIFEQGKISKKYDDQHYKSMWHRLLDLAFSFISDNDDGSSSDLFSGANFYLFKDYQFIVSEKAFNTLDEEIEHILYFTPNSKKLLNIEPVSK